MNKDEKDSNISPNIGSYWRRKISVVIPTRKLRNDFITMKILEKLKANLKDNLEVIIRRDKGVSRARNAGVMEAKGEIICFLEDDISFNEQELLSLLKSYQEGTVVTADFFIPDRPMIGRVTIISKKDFVLVGGFDEDIRFGGEGAGFMLRSMQNGIKWKPVKINLKHLSRPYSIKIEMIRAFYETAVLLKWKFKYMPTTSKLIKFWIKSHKFPSLASFILFYFFPDLFPFTTTCSPELSGAIRDN